MRRPLIRGEDFEASIGEGEQAQGRSWRLFKGEGNHLGGVCVFFFGKGKKKEKECVTSSYVWKVLFMREMCVRIKHGKIYMTKRMECYFKELLLPNPPLDLCQISKSSCLGGVKGFHQISTPSV